jgi:hypothetical protein
MGVARSVTQRMLKGSVLPALATVGGWLRLDRAFEGTWRFARRKRIRMMRPMEIHEAERVFGSSIPFERVRIVEDSPLARRVAALSGQVHLEQDRPLAVTLFLTIHFTHRLSRDTSDMPWLAHELTHVWQYLQRGPRYLTDALRAQAQHGKAAYDITKGVAEGWPWDAFNAEQQGEIARELYKALVKGDDVGPFLTYAEVLQGKRSVSRAA